MIYIINDCEILPCIKNSTIGASKIPRGTSRKRPSVPSTPAGPRIDWLATLEAFPKCAPPPGEFPTNPGPYRYVLAECDKNSSLSESYLNNPEAWHGPPGRPIPGHMYRVFVEDRIFLSTQETGTAVFAVSAGFCVAEWTSACRYH